jgi:hypothetical protein
MQEAEAIPEGEGLHRPIFGERVDIFDDDAANRVLFEGEEFIERRFVHAIAQDPVDQCGGDWHVDDLAPGCAGDHLHEGQGAVESGVDAEDDGFHFSIYHHRTYELPVLKHRSITFDRARFTAPVHWCIVLESPFL